MKRISLVIGMVGCSNGIADTKDGGELVKLRAEVERLKTMLTVDRNGDDNAPTAPAWGWWCGEKLCTRNLGDCRDGSKVDCKPNRIAFCLADVPAIETKCFTKRYACEGSRGDPHTCFGVE